MKCVDSVVAVSPVPEPLAHPSALPTALALDLDTELSQCRKSKPWPSGVSSKLLFKTDDLRLVLICLDTAAKIKEHHADGTISIHCLDGDLCVHVGDQAFDVHAGQILTVLAGLKHDVEAREESAFLLTISWPTDAKLHEHRREGYVV